MFVLGSVYRYLIVFTFTGLYKLLMIVARCLALSSLQGGRDPTGPVHRPLRVETVGQDFSQKSGCKRYPPKCNNLTDGQPWWTKFHARFSLTVWLTLGVLTVVVKGRVPRSRCRTEFVAIYVLSCLHVRFVCEFSCFSGGRGQRGRVLYANFRIFRLVNLFDVHFSW